MYRVLTSPLTSTWHNKCVQWMCVYSIQTDMSLSVLHCMQTWAFWSYVGLSTRKLSVHLAHLGLVFRSLINGLKENKLQGFYCKTETLCIYSIIAVPVALCRMPFTKWWRDDWWQDALHCWILLICVSDAAAAAVIVCCIKNFHITNEKENIHHN